MFKRQGTVPTLNGVSVEMGLPERDLRKQLNSQSRLDNLCGLSLQQAHLLIECYGESGFFTELITRNVIDAIVGRQRLERIENRKKRDNDPSAGPAGAE
jgi:hypothetical protein